jgi:hypothetical protein
MLYFAVLSKNVKIKMYRTIVLSVVLYRCESWSLILREGCRWKVFENRMLRRIIVPKRDEVTGEWRRCLCSVLTKYHSGDQIKKTEMGGACSRYGGQER